MTFTKSQTKVSLTADEVNILDEAKNILSNILDYMLNEEHSLIKDEGGYYLAFTDEDAGTAHLLLEMLVHHGENGEVILKSIV